jgi:hypothetical protein
MAGDQRTPTPSPHTAWPDLSLIEIETVSSYRFWAIVENLLAYRACFSSLPVPPMKFGGGG